MNVLDSPGRHQQTMLNIEIDVFVDGVVEGVPHTIPIVGMKSLKHQLQRGLNRAIILKDRVGFIRPVDFSTRNVPAEATCVTDALPLSQEGFAAVQVRVEGSVFQRNRGLRSQQLQHCDPVRREGARSQIVLQIERADNLRLFHDGQA